MERKAMSKSYPTSLSFEEEYNSNGIDDEKLKEIITYFKNRNRGRRKRS